MSSSVVFIYWGSRLSHLRSNYPDSFSVTGTGSCSLFTLRHIVHCALCIHWYLYCQQLRITYLYINSFPTSFPQTDLCVVNLMICFAVVLDLKMFSLFVNYTLLKCWYCYPFIFLVFIRFRFASTAVATNLPVGHMEYKALSSSKKSDLFEILHLNTLYQHI